MSVPVTARDTAGGWPVASLARTTTPGPHARGDGQLTPNPHLLSRVLPRQEGAPRPVPKGSAGSSARVQHLPGSSPRHRRRGPRAAPLGSRPNLRRRPATASPPQALLTWSWPKARSTAVTPASPAGKSVGATDETLSRDRRVPDPRKSWTDRPPSGGVTIRFREREPGPPLGPAFRRHPLHPRSGARPRLPRDGKERTK